MGHKLTPTYAIKLFIEAEEIPPYGCSNCPFSTELVDPLNGEGANPSDPDEGYYSCDLLKGAEIKRRNGAKGWHPEAVWGESPLCMLTDWKARAYQELSALTGEVEK